MERISLPPHRVARQEGGITPDGDDVTFYGLQAYFRDVLSGKYSFNELTRIPRQELLPHVLNGIKLVEKIDKAERASNGLFQDMRWNPRNPSQRSLFGRVLHDAMHNPHLTHHYWEHNERVEEVAFAIALNVPELRQQRELFPWIESIMLFARWHDVDQLLTLHRNITRKENHLPELVSKLGHGPAGAVMILALHKRYAEEANISVREAWHICAGAAAMILTHDVPESHHVTVKARKAAWKETRDKNGRKRKRYYHGEQLRFKFNRREIDIFSLSPRQILELTRLQKGLDKEFLKNSRFGLHSAFEREYEEELNDLYNNNMPLMRDIVENPQMYESWRTGYETAAEIGLRADLADMVTPPYEEILRKLALPMSLRRPFLRKMRLADQMDQIVEGQGNVDLLVDSDVRRTLWEFFHLDPIKGSTIADSAYLKKFNRDNVIMGVLAFRDFGPQLLSGDLSFVDKVYEHRVMQLGNRAIAQAGVPFWRRILHAGQMRQAKVMSYKITQVEKTIHLYNADVAKRYKKRADELWEECLEIKSSLSKKQHTDYPDQNDVSRMISDFHKIVDEALGRLCVLYEVTPKQLKRYSSLVAQGRYPDLPYKTYDSFGGVPRTYMSPRKSTLLEFLHKQETIQESVRK